MRLEEMKERIELTPYQKKLVEEIERLKERKNATVLVHNYQRPEIYAVADFIGDSLGLSKEATRTKADLIIFCGVDFMAETAAILNPDKKVLIPSRKAKCPMAAMVTGKDLTYLKEKFPDTPVVSYVNTTAETKAESYICCTSANAVRVVNSLPANEVIFVPDENLASYVSRFTSKKVIPWNGYCYVHVKFSVEGLKEAKRLHPAAETIVHPECKPEIIDLADRVGSTSQMIRYVEESEAEEFIIGTGVGLIERLKLEFPEKKFYSVPPGSTCFQMKETTLDLVFKSLEKEIYEVRLEEGVRKKARRAIERMLKV